MTLVAFVLWTDRESFRLFLPGAFFKNAFTNGCIIPSFRYEKYHGYLVEEKDLSRLWRGMYIEKQPEQGQEFCHWPVRADSFFREICMEKRGSAFINHTARSGRWIDERLSLSRFITI